MFASLQRHWNRRHLTDERFAFLFDEPHPDEIVVYDCETTGLNPKVDNIILIGAVKIKGNKILTDEAIERFLYYIGNRKLLGYYLEFDVAMVNKYTKKLFGITLPNRQEEVSAIYYDQKIGTIPQGNIYLRFDTILKELKLPRLKAHDALNDAVMTAMIYLKLQHVKRV